MNVEKIVVDRDKAKELYRKYREHQFYSAPIDLEIQRTYKLIAQGRVVIKAIESIQKAGCGADGLPKLAIANATAQTCHLQYWANGQACMSQAERPNSKDRTNTFRFGGLPPRQSHVWNAQAVVPLVPIHLRPKRALGNYHILWEAIWKRVPPVDPMLLRRLGGDMWLVVAAWDLTDVERAAMATRLSG